MALIKNHELVSDAWTFLAGDAAVPGEGDVVVDLARFKAERDALLARKGGKLGVRLTTADQPDDIVADLGNLALLAVEFPKYVDGRGYSLARLLRERHGFKGELRAVGDVLRDQLLYMQRCGFDAFELKAGKDADGALEAFRELGVHYQGTTEDPRPLFRRRA